MNRDRMLCVACGVSIVNQPGSVHHRKPRGMGGTSKNDDPSNLITLCGTATTGCHQQVEAHRGHAREQGLLVRMRHAPDMVPVRHWDGRLYWLNRDGSIESCPERKPEPGPDEVNGDQP